MHQRPYELPQVNFLRKVRRISGIAASPVFKVEAIRRYAISRAVSESTQISKYPTIEAKHLDNPRLFANRNDLISSMQSMKGGVVAEIGVAEGVFSEYLLNELQPRKFVAFDIFTMHEWAGMAGGVKPNLLLDNMTHLDYYKRRFADRGSQVIIEVGMSNVNLAKYPDKFFNLIYIDGDHSYEGVRQDANLAKAKLSDDGIIVFNDYLLFDHIKGTPYGVVQAVNELIVNEDWRVCGFALQSTMFCDIAIRKQSGLPL
jgi:hypothetical protein